MKRYIIPIVLGVALVLGGVLLYWHFVINQVLDRNGMENPFPPDDTELPGIPMDAALLSLNWSQSAMSFAECFHFDLAAEDSGYVISGECADPENGERVERENAPLTAEDWAKVVLLFLLCTAYGNAEGQIAPQDDPNEGLGGGLNEDTVNDFSGFEGIWLGEANSDYDSMEFDAEGNWTLYLSGEVVDDGYLRYEPEWEAIYAYSNLDDSGSLIAMEDGQLYSAAYGYFNPGEGMEYLWYEDGGCLTEDDEPDPSGDEVPDWNGSLDGDPDSYWSWDSDLCQRNVSEFEGIWYYDGDLSAETYIVIDGNGNWSYYQRAPGAEPAEMDCGVFTYSMDEVSTYYADSTMYDGVSYRVFEVDEDSLVWGDEGVYYMME